MTQKQEQNLGQTESWSPPIAQLASEVKVGQNKKTDPPKQARKSSSFPRTCEDFL